MSKLTNKCSPGGNGVSVENVQQGGEVVSPIIGKKKNFTDFTGKKANASALHYYSGGRFTV